MKRVQVTEEELAILEGLRHEKAIWNKALEAAATHIATTKLEDMTIPEIQSLILELRK